MNRSINFTETKPPDLKKCKVNYSPIEISDSESDNSIEEIRKIPILREDAFPLYMNCSKYEEDCAGKLRFKSLLNACCENNQKNTCWSLKDIIIASYIIDIDWVVNELTSVIEKNLLENLLFISHDESNQNLTISPKLNHSISRKIDFYFPQIKVPFGVFHSKFMLIHFESLKNNSKSFMRFVITSANFIKRDWEEKSQNIWVQDFPKTNVYEESRSEFKNYLIEFLQSIILNKALIRMWTEIINGFNFNSATGELIGSVPGYFKDPKDKTKWGHLRVNSLLEEIGKKKPEKNKTIGDDDTEDLVMQFSSIGRISRRWFYNEFSLSLSNSIKNSPQIVFPTTEQVINSYEGISGGASLPAKKVYIEKPWVRNLLCLWGIGDPNNLSDRLIPHSKTFISYRNHNNGPPKITWVIQGSHNLSAAAWGQLQKETQFCIRNYELSILIHRETFNHLNLHDSRGDECKYSKFTWGPRDNNEVDITKDKHEYALNISLPFSVPPKPYSICDSPWYIELLIDAQTHF